jgi:type I restriction enzyme, S subunit
MNGPMKSGKNFKLGELGKIVTGRTPPSSRPECFGDAIPFITPTDMNGRRFMSSTARYLSDPGIELLQNIAIPPLSVCVSCIGWQLGKVVMTKHKSVTNQQINTIIPNEQVDPFFLYYLLHTKRDLMRNLGAVGVRTPIVNKTVFSNIEVELPPLPTQRRIAYILSTYDDLIENNIRRIAILEEMVRRVYEEWFVRFRFPGHEIGKSDWKAICLGDVVTLDKGISYKGKFLDEAGKAMINLKNFDRSGGFRRDGLKFYKGDHKPRHMVAPGTIVLANTDLTQAGDIIGSPATVPRAIPTADAIISHHVFAVRLGQEVLGEPSFIYQTLASAAFKAFARGHASGTTVLGLHRDSIQAFEFELPPMNIRKNFEAGSAPIRTLIEVLAEKTANLQAQRDLLLPKLVSGGIDVSEVPSPDAVIEAA